MKSVRFSGGDRHDPEKDSCAMWLLAGPIPAASSLALWKDSRLGVGVRLAMAEASRDVVAPAV
jgi:hypothetical protein